MVIVILIMTLLTLIVIAMTKNANREQRQALDRQLNSQAFYAAESGVNDAKDYYIKNALNSVGAAPAEKKKCDGSETNAPTGEQFPGNEYKSQVGEANNKYSCVLYDVNPPSLEFTKVDIGKSIITPLEDVNPNTPIQTLTFTWKKPNVSDYNFAGCPAAFTTALNNCDAGVLRIELIDTNSGSRDQLIANNFLSFASPNASGTNPTAYSSGIGTAAQGVNWKGSCSNGPSGKCSLTITGINKTKLMLHMRSIYNENSVSITGTKVGGDAVEFKDAQMMVDSTGRSSDILKRIQVRVPLNDFGSRLYPEFALQTAEDICKLLQVIPGGQSISSSNGCN